jgi:hypothetical protein
VLLSFERLSFSDGRCHASTSALRREIHYVRRGGRGIRFAGVGHLLRCVTLLVLAGLLTAGCGGVHGSTAGHPVGIPASTACRPPDRTLDTLAAQIKTGMVRLPDHKPVAELAEPQGQIPLGIAADLRSRRGPDLGNVLMRMASAHLRYSREDFTWWTIEPRRGVFCWAQTDSWMYAAARAGIQILAIPDAPPTWAEPSPTTAPTDPAGLQAYAAFVRELLGRYGSYGSFWNRHPKLHPNPITLVDVWNEPYSSQFWSRSYPDPAGYAAMFETVVRTARPVDPRARFLLEADTTALTAAGQKPFLAPVLSAQPDIAQDAYAVSVHLYASNGWGPSVCDTEGSIETRRFQLCQIQDVRHILDSHDASRVGLFITEIGWSTSTANPWGVNPQVASRYIHETFSLLRTRWKGLLSGLIWYDYQSPERDAHHLNDFYGLVHPDGVPGPGWYALAEEAQLGSIPGAF